MSDHEPKLAEGLLEYLQAVGGGWSAKLTMERLAFAKTITELATEVEKLTTQIKLNVDYATQCATVEKERDELKREHDTEVEQLKSMLDQIETRNDVATTPQAVELEELRQAHENCYAYAAEINKDRGSLKTEVERLKLHLEHRSGKHHSPDRVPNCPGCLDAEEAKKRG